jgi:methylated-DNA-[protein]-cysteine S-methyltransferase
MGDWRDAPSGLNCEKKLALLKEEGVEFDEKGMLIDKSLWWNAFEV